MDKTLNFSVQEPIPVNVCYPSPCGPNSQCREINEQAVCSCLPSYNGEPPLCKAECLSHSDCATDKACLNQKCVNPCPSPCGQMADCRVFHHNPICSCRSGFTGDPFTRCYSKPGERNYTILYMKQETVVLSNVKILIGLVIFSDSTTVR